MRYCVWLITLLFCNSFLIGQTQENIASLDQQTRRLSASMDHTLTKAEITRNETERGLSQLITQYRKSLSGARPQIRLQVEKSLYTLFDLNLELLSKEARRIRYQLETMSTQTADSSKADELAYLKRALKEVESRISFRQENRVQIVSARLSQLLDEG